MSNLSNEETVEPLYILNPHVTRDTLTDGLNENLSKLESLAYMALCDDFADFPKPIIYHYLWVLSDAVKQLKEIINAIALKQR